eukprot:3997203-Lingulodinium_polyedra.AAC.2
MSGDTAKERNLFLTAAAMKLQRLGRGLWMWQECSEPEHQVGTRKHWYTAANSRTGAMMMEWNNHA